MASSLDGLCHARAWSGQPLSIGLPFPGADPFHAATWGLDFHRANLLEVAGGVLTGQVTGQIVDRSVKAQMLARWASECELELTRTIAVGDGANDLEMLAAAGLGIAFNAKPIVRQKAPLALDGSLARIIPLLP